MPRRSGGSSFRSSSGRGFSPFRSSRSSYTQSRPMQAPPQPTSYVRSPGMFGGIGSTIATGMAFGAGSQIAHQAIRGIMGSSYQPVYIQQQPGQTDAQYREQVQ